MKVSYFPTIKEIACAVMYMHNVSNEWSYNENTHIFKFIELVPYAVRDSGGSIDSIDYDECPIELAFTQAYNTWKDYDDLCHPERDYPLPMPCEDFIDENYLPF